MFGMISGDCYYSKCYDINLHEFTVPLPYKAVSRIIL